MDGNNDNLQVFLLRLDTVEDNLTIIEEDKIATGRLVTNIVRSGDFFLCSDLLQSCSLLHYNHITIHLEILAHDSSVSWVTSCEIIDDEYFIVSDDNGNIFTLKRNTEFNSDEEKKILQRVGFFHLGEVVNVFKRGSLVYRYNDRENSKFSNQIIFGTASGLLGVLCPISAEQYQFFLALQNQINSFISGIGGFSHSK